MQKLRNFSTSIFVILALCIIFVFTGCDSPLGLQSKIQKEFDSNPFLKEEKINLKVIKEENGYVTVEFDGGGPELRDYISKGADLFSPMIDTDFQLHQKSETKTYNVLKKALETVKSIKGVKAISLINSAKNIYEGIYKEGYNLLTRGCLEYNNRRDCEKAASLFQQAAAMGSSAAQIELAKMYRSGRGVPLDTLKCIELYKNVAEGNSDEYYKSLAQGALGMLYEEGAGEIAQDYSKAIEWYLKASTNKDLVFVPRQLAWIYGTCKDPKYRDGQKSLEYALKACDDNYCSHKVVAAAYAASGNFEKAVEEQEKHINKLTNDLKTGGSRIGNQDYKRKIFATLEKQLTLYKARQAYIQDDNDTIDSMF